MSYLNHLSKFGLELYGFSGKLGTGKNYIAEKLFLSMLPKKNTIVMALADHFKVDCCAKDRVDYSKVFITKDNQTRVLLQKRGTEEGHMKYGEDIWIRTLGTWIRMYQERGVERVIVTDLRFPNEVEWLRSMGGKSFRVEAPARNRDKLLQEANGNLELYQQMIKLEMVGENKGEANENGGENLDEENDLELKEFTRKYQLIANHASEIALDNYQDFDYIIRNDYQDQTGMPNQIRDIIRELIWKKPVELVIFCDLDDTICECKKFYRLIINQVMETIRAETGISETNLTELLNKHVLSFEQRYFTRDDFARSLVKVYMEAYLRQDLMLEYSRVKADQIYQLGLTVYDYHYDPLHEDSVDRVREMFQFGQVVLFTLGDHTEQMKKIAHLGLLDLPIEIFTHKDENMFRYLMNKYPAKQYVMIGDSYYRDIIPAQQAGINHLVLITSDLDRKMISSGELGGKLVADQQTDEHKEIFQIDRLNDSLMNHLSKLK